MTVVHEVVQGMHADTKSKANIALDNIEKAKIQKTYSKYLKR